MIFFVIVHTHKCILLHNCILILRRVHEAFSSYFFLTLSVFNFLDIPNFLHWVYFGFGSLYFCFGLAVYFFFGCFSLNALVIPPPIIGLIQQLPISLLQAEDRLIWRLSPNGVYFVKTGYKAIMNFGGYFEQ